MSIYPNWKGERVYAIAVFVLIVSAIIYLGVKIDNIVRQSKEVGQPTPYEHTIMIEGEGTVTGKPDIATFVMGTESHGVDAAAAQTANSTIMNKIIEDTKGLGISEDDIQTSGYNIYEDLQWNSDTGDYDSKGWIVSNYVTVKVRDVSKLSTVLAMAGQNGITDISGPTFTIDDTTNLKAEARTEAIQQAQTKAQAIATALGMRIEKVVGYSEWSPSIYDYSYAYGMGGSDEKLSSAMPSIEAGSTEVSLTVSITYKLAE
ncbi:MAG: SIMPL domain-containing protein [Patescibacteria group bacterium]